MDRHPPVAVLGCGSIGNRHLRNLSALGCTGLVAFDPDPQVGATVARESGIPVTSSIDEVWEWSHAIALIAAPTNHHIELALAAAQTGCHLFIEKPLSHTLENLSPIVEEVERRGLVSMVGCNMRFHPGPSQVKWWLNDGIIGKIMSARIQTGSYLPGWRPQQDYRTSYSASQEWGGAVLDCIHEIDLALWLLGDGTVTAAVTRPASSLELKTDGLSETFGNALCLRRQPGGLRIGRSA